MCCCFVSASAIVNYSRKKAETVVENNRCGYQCCAANRGHCNNNNNVESYDIKCFQQTFKNEKQKKKRLQLFKLLREFTLATVVAAASQSQSPTPLS